MKKLSYVFLGIVIGGLIVFFITSKPVEEVVPVIVKPSKVITQEEARTLNNNWTQYRKQVVDSAARAQGATKDDTRSVYWNIEDIENYLAWAGYQADSLGYTLKGIRVYLGVYGKNTGQLKKDLTTMFIVPTGIKNISKGSFIALQSGGGNLPIDPLNVGSGGQGGYDEE